MGRPSVPRHNSIRFPKERCGCRTTRRCGVSVPDSWWDWDFTELRGRSNAPALLLVDEPQAKSNAWWRRREPCPAARLQACDASVSRRRPPAVRVLVPAGIHRRQQRLRGNWQHASVRRRRGLGLGQLRHRGRAGGQLTRLAGFLGSNDGGPWRSFEVRYKSLTKSTICTTILA